MLEIQSIKASLNILEVAAPFCDGLVKTGTCYQAKTNPLRSEKTSSLYFYEDSQTYHDFGSGEHGDVIDLYKKATNKSTAEALKDLSSEHHLKPATPKLSEAIKEPNNVSPVFESFEPISLEIHQAELEKLFPLWLIEESASANLALVLSRLRFDSENKTLAYAIKNKEGQIVGVKRQRFKINGELKKWIAVKGSEVSHCYSRIEKVDTPVFILEGIKDGLNAILLGMNCIALPSAHYKGFTQAEIHELKGRDLVFIADTDEVGIACMRRLAAQIESACKSLFILDLRRFLNYCYSNIGFEPTQKIDFADAVMMHAKIGGKPHFTGYGKCFVTHLLHYIQYIQEGEQ